MKNMSRVVNILIFCLVFYFRKRHWQFQNFLLRRAFRSERSERWEWLGISSRNFYILRTLNYRSTAVLITYAATLTKLSAVQCPLSTMDVGFQLTVFFHWGRLHCTCAQGRTAKFLIWGDAFFKIVGKKQP